MGLLSREAGDAATWAGGLQRGKRLLLLPACECRVNESPVLGTGRAVWGDVSLPKCSDRRTRLCLVAVGGEGHTPAPCTADLFFGRRVKF